MYLGRTTDNKEEMHRKPPFGPGFTELGTAVTMQICQRVGVKRVEGY
jgi:hypothetical protein